MIHKEILPILMFLFAVKLFVIMETCLIFVNMFMLLVLTTRWKKKIPNHAVITVMLHLSCPIHKRAQLMQ